MPSIANITVKKDDGTTDIVWTGVQPSSGEGTPAVWQSQSVGTAIAHRPEFRLSSRDGQKGASRAFRGTFQYPRIATNSTTGVTSVIGKVSISFNADMPKDMVAVDVNEAVSQFANLFGSALVKSCLKTGYSAS